MNREGLPTAKDTKGRCSRICASRYRSHTVLLVSKAEERATLSNVFRNKFTNCSEDRLIFRVH